MTSLPVTAPKQQRIPSQSRKVTQPITPHSTRPTEKDDLLLTHEENTHLSSTPQLTDPSATTLGQHLPVSHPLLPSFSSPRNPPLDLNDEEELSNCLDSSNMTMQPQLRPIKISTGQQTCQPKLDTSYLDASHLMTLQHLTPRPHPLPSPPDSVDILIRTGNQNTGHFKLKKHI